MKKKNISIGDALIKIASGGLFIFFIGPALGIAAGMLFSMWAEGRDVMSPWTIGFNSTALIIYLSSYVHLRGKDQFKTNLRVAMGMLIIGIILLPLQSGMYIELSDSLVADIHTTSPQASIDEIAYNFMRYGGIFTSLVSIASSIIAIIESKSTNDAHREISHIDLNTGIVTYKDENQL
ncbi:hypothetical protein ABNR98_004425 [Salmonella enterica]